MNASTHKAIERESDAMYERLRICASRGCRNASPIVGYRGGLCVHCRNGKVSSLAAANGEIRELRKEVRRLQSLLSEANAALRRRKDRSEQSERLLAMQKVYVPADRLEPQIPGRRHPVEYCYLIRCEATGNLKIGKAVNVERRLAGLRISSPNELILVAALQTKDGLELESQMHTRFAAHRIRGEWFHSHPDILDAFGVQP